MALLSLVVVPAKVRKGGKHNIRVAVAHNGQTRYIVTDIIINSLKEWKNGQVVGRSDANILNTRLRKILAEYEKVLGELFYIDGLTCAQLVSSIKDFHQEENKTIEAVFNEMIESTTVAKHTKSVFGYVRNDIILALGKNKLIRALRNVDVKKYIQHLEKRGKAPSTIRNYVTIFSSAYNFARRNRYVKNDISPFEGLHLPQYTVDDRWASVEALRKIRDFVPPQEYKQMRMRKTIDFFLLSYYLGGINLNDIVHINFADMEHQFSYTRAKVCKKWNHNASMLTFDTPPEAWTIIKEYMLPTGYLDIKESTFMTFNMHLALISEQLGIPKVSMKSARKSFAQHAFDLGVSDRVIDRVLGHVPNRSGSVMHHYIMVTDTMVNDCIRRVIDNLNSDKRKSQDFPASAPCQTFKHVQ